MTPDLGDMQTPIGGKVRPATRLSASLERPSIKLALLTLAASAGFYARTALSPLQESVRQALGLSDNQIAILQGPAMALPILLAAIPLGMLIDRSIRVRILLAAMIFGAGGSVLTALAPNFVFLLLARSIVGVSASALWLCAVSLLSDIFVPEKRGRANALLAVGQVFSAAAAFALGGHLLDAAAGPDAWRMAMLWLCVPLMAIILLLPLLREPPRVGMPDRRSPPGATFRRLWQHRRVIAPLLVGMAMVDIAVGAVVIWTAPNLARSYHLSPAQIGTVMGFVMLIGGLVGPLTGGYIFDRSQRAGGPRRSMVALFLLALVTVPAGLFPVMPTAALAIAFLVAFKIVNMAISVASTTLATVIVPADLRGVSTAVLSAVAMLFSLGIAPLAVSLIMGALGGSEMLGHALAIVCLVTSFLGAIIFGLSVRNYPGSAE